MAQNRIGEVRRETKETKVDLKLNLDGKGRFDIRTPVPFFNHMLEQLARHGGFDLDIAAEGDVHIDFHHTVEDVGICFGQALASALGDKAGIRRYGECTLPMQEALVRTSLDICGRPHLYYYVKFPHEKVGNFDVELAQDFFIAISNNAGITAHIDLLRGENMHHIIEGIFKSYTKALSAAVTLDSRVAGVPTTKGML